MEVNESMRKSFLQFEPAPRRGEPEARPFLSCVSPLMCCLSEPHGVHVITPSCGGASLRLHACADWHPTSVLRFCIGPLVLEARLMPVEDALRR